jgi:hypothetical protein
MLYKLNHDGALVTSYTTTATSSWGWRDMAWDGTYLYASEDASGGVFYIQMINPLSANPGSPNNFIQVTGQGANFARALAWDPVSEHFFAGNASSNLMEIDRAGIVIRTVPCPAPLNYVFGMAWDADGPGGPWLWIHDQSGTPSHTLYKMDPVTMTLTGSSYNYGALPPNTNGVAAGLAYTTQWDPSYSSMIVLEQGTPLDRIAGLEMYLLVLPAAPNVPQNFTVNHNNAELIATLSWTNPSTQFNGQPLTSLTGMHITRNGVHLPDYTNVQIGMPSTVNDTVPSANTYNYTIIPYNAVGNGPLVFSGTWIGLDIPTRPGNFTVTPDTNWALTANLAWNEPTAGVHNGYFPPGSVTGYYIYRAPAGGTLVRIGTSTTSSYVDHPTSHGWYFYGVAGYNNSGTGDTVQSNVVFIGQPEFQSIPYNWTEISNNGINSGITGSGQNMGPFPIGFSFPYYNGSIYNEVRICTEGWASFTSTATTGSNTSIPNTSEPNNLLAPFWDNLTFSGVGSQILYLTLHDPTRFIIEWYRVDQSGAGVSPRNFQLILWPNGNIDYMWHSFVGGVTNLATVGIENSRGTEGIQCSYNGSGPVNPVAGTGVRIYAVGAVPVMSNISLTMTPVNPPIVIPATGGSFNFNVIIQSDTSVNAMFDAWTMMTLPNGVTNGPYILREYLVLSANATLVKTPTMTIPIFAMAGEYTLLGYVGDFPDTACDADSFNFTKLAGDVYGKSGTWKISGWGEDEYFNLPAMFPEIFTPKLTATPNPFNSSVVISFELPDASPFDLKIYNIAGREVWRLETRDLRLGTNQVEWNAEGMSSGVYFVRLSVDGGQSIVRKVVLMK